MSDAGTSMCDGRMAGRGVDIGHLQHQLLDPDEVGQHLGDGAEQRAGNLVADIGALKSAWASGTFSTIGTPASAPAA